ncbi:phage portal protein [uncultured Roseibium sp.]|uniref:phage portal protein n=1 Tax=uncultured Roseibium sp. TaxID=1936171 RepID=UPI002630DC86|nr:phage portal protein [uncultured Roseibium sp.]
MRLPFFPKSEKRGEVPSGSVPVSYRNFLEMITGLAGGGSAAGISVTTEKALGVPAVSAAVNFLSGTMAGLPLNIYRRKGEGREKVSGKLARLLHDVANDETTSFNWRKQLFDSVLTDGRHVTFIERSRTGEPINLWPLDPTGTTVKRQNGRKFYEYRDGSRTLTYEASEVLDLFYMLKPDGLGHRGPIDLHKDTIALGIAATNFGSKFFQNGGVPPFAVKGAFQSEKAMQRAAQDLEGAVRNAAKNDRMALVLPIGLDIEQLGADAEKSQLVELKRFVIEEVARIYSLPPTFLQDLTHGTFSNTEQQDLHFVKHTLKRWVEQFEQELNLKLFGRASNTRFAEMNMDGLLRGDFKTRMDGYATGIQNAILMPNEARRRENLPDDPSGNTLMIQGATVPVGQQPATTQTPEEGDDAA